MRLLSSLRQKKRYVVVEFRSAQPLRFPELGEEVEKALLLFFGQWGLAQSSPFLLQEKWNAKTQRFIIKINHTFVDELKAALSLIQKVKNQPVVVRSIITSGSLKKANSYLNREV